MESSKAMCDDTAPILVLSCLLDILYSFQGKPPKGSPPYICLSLSNDYYYTASKAEVELLAQKTPEEYITSIQSYFQNIKLSFYH